MESKRERRIRLTAKNAELRRELRRTLLDAETYLAANAATHDWDRGAFIVSCLMSRFAIRLKEK